MDESTLQVTHLVIPSQIGDRASCESTGESDTVMWDYFDSEQILLVGWVHSHPLYDSFFSSVDLHGQFQFQSSFPQFLGLVYSGINGGIHGFHLTNAGLRSVHQCILNPIDSAGNMINIYRPHTKHDITPGLLYENIDKNIKLVPGKIKVKDFYSQTFV